MPESFSKFLTEFSALPPARQAAILATAIGSLAFFVWLALDLGAPQERLLYGQLQPEEASRVVDALRGQNIPYRLDHGGTAVFVPAGVVHEARIRLAGNGLPSGDAAGFELFDRSGFGVSDFVNRVNYQRALQGELARSIEQLAAVDRARVQLAIPEKRGLVKSKDEESTASVVVKLRPGSALDAGQVRGIVHLVASAIEGLPAERVSLVDDRGQLLSSNGESDPASHRLGALRHQEQLETELAERIESMLAPTVGAGRVVARVRAKLDWTQTEETAESFDPDGQVARSEEVSTEETEEGSAAAVAGAAANVPNLGGGGGGTTQGSKRQTETINYEISKVVKHTVGAAGSIRQLDVAVLVDGQPGNDSEFVAWGAEDLTRFEELAKRAVGYDEERGDKITLSSAPFLPDVAGPVDAGGFSIAPEWILVGGSLLRIAGLLLALVVFARLVAAPLATSLATNASASLPARAGDLEAQLAAGGDGTLALPDETGEGQFSGPGGEEAVKTLRVWLSER